MASGTHAWCRAGGARRIDPWWTRLDPADYTTALITDCRESAESAWANSLSEVELLEPMDRAADWMEPSSARATNETELGSFFAAVAARLAHMREPYLLVAHTRGLYGRWDAPQAWRQQFVDEDDPDPPGWLWPPMEEITTDYDPDWLHGVRAAAGAQVMLADQCLDALLDQLAESNAQRVRVAVTASRGFGLGEHRSIGDAGANLHEEMVHVPLVLYDPALRSLSYRRGPLVQMADVAVSLQGALGLSPQDCCGAFCAAQAEPLEDGDRSGQQALAMTLADGRIRLQTPFWCCLADWSRHPADPAQLFVKPDDRWELNDVSDRCPLVIDGFRTLWQTLHELPGGCYHHRSFQIPPRLLEPAG
jgi:arylsulfatase A-like enzyme